MPTLFTQVVNLVSVAVVAVAFGLVWRQSLPGRLALFAVQSVLLAALAAAVALFTARVELGLVALAVLTLKGWVIPRILARVVPPQPRPARRGRAGRRRDSCSEPPPWSSWPTR
jgi:hydrogenase-4 membrane subunit HyfE